MEYQIVQCQGCLAISFCECSSSSEDLDMDPRGDLRPQVTRKFFPNRIAGRSVMQDMHLLPIGVRTIYEEAHAALCAELAIMAGFGIRAIVEAVCKNKAITGDNLKSKIDRLATDGHITQAGKDILHHLRFMGNAAAHEMKSHDASEMNAAFDVVEYLLQGVYVLPERAKRLPKPRKAKGSTAAGT